jgi:hypothetical protein
MSNYTCTLLWLWAKVDFPHDCCLGCRILEQFVLSLFVAWDGIWRKIRQTWPCKIVEPLLYFESNSVLLPVHLSFPPFSDALSAFESVSHAASSSSFSRCFKSRLSCQMASIVGSSRRNSWAFFHCVMRHGTTIYTRFRSMLVCETILSWFAGCIIPNNYWTLSSDWVE